MLLFWSPRFITCHIAPRYRTRILLAIARAIYLLQPLPILQYQEPTRHRLHNHKNRPVYNTRNRPVIVYTIIRTDPFKNRPVYVVLLMPFTSKTLSDFLEWGCLIGEVNNKSDAQLLRDYVQSHDEPAFHEIVIRYTDLVYSAALRQVESADLGADIAQSVFVDLAHKARPLCERLAEDSSLGGWLHRATRYAALKHLRDDQRRITNERQAMTQLLVDAEPPADWEQIRPALDEAIDSLNDEDREAILLRYFKNQNLRAVGRALGVSDDTAQKRVSRAVDRLREILSKRNVTISASGLTLLISANAVQSAPIGLAAAILKAAVFAKTAVSTSSAITATKVITMTTLQKAIITTTIAALAGAGIYEAHQTSRLHDQIQRLQQEQAAQILQFQQERDDATNQIANLLAENSQLKANPHELELLKLRSQSVQAQATAQELARFKAANRKNGVMSTIFTNAIVQGMSVAAESKKKAALAKVARMKEKLHLTDDQAQAIDDLMVRHIEASSQQVLNAISGGQWPESSQSSTPNPDNLNSEEAEIKALLTPEQLAAYPDFQQSESVYKADTSAKSDLAVIATKIELSQEQQDKVYTALYQYQLSQAATDQNAEAIAQAHANGNYADIINLQIQAQKQALEDKSKILDGILTPDQLQTYRQIQMDRINLQSNALKMFLPQANAATQ